MNKQFLLLAGVLLALALIGLVCLGLLCAAAFADEPDAIPPDAIQLIANPGFEGGIYPWAMGCSGGGSAEVDWHNPYTGLMHLVHWGPAAVCWTRQWFSLSGCEPGSVWLSFAWEVQTPLPFVPGEAGRDRTDVWISNELGQNVTPTIPYGTLFTRFDYDYGSDYEPILIRVDNLFDACTTCRLDVGTVINDNLDSVSAFFYDDLELWCVPLATEAAYTVYLPLVME